LASLTEVIELIESGEARVYFQSMLDAWRAGDVRALDHLLREALATEAMVPLFVEMLDRRNREMADTLVRRLDRPATGPSLRLAPVISAGLPGCWQSWPGGAIS
jgi:uncharacterized protein YbaP (TraB family)